MDIEDTKNIRDLETFTFSFLNFNYYLQCFILMKK